MVITPNSRVILLKSPLKLDNYNQITFNNSSQQFDYFYNLPKIEEWDYTYVRKDGVIRVATNSSLTFEDLLQYNYCMYQNTSYDNKWFYAFVTDITYINDGMTEVKIETDTFQSWQFELQYKNSFVEREHVSDDTIGLHTIPEGLETGEYIVNSSGDVETDLDTTYYCVGVSWLPDNTPFYTRNRVYGGVFSGVSYILFKFTESVAKFVQAIDTLGKNSSATIVNIFMIPQTLTGVSYTDERWRTESLGGQSGINFCILPNQISTTLRNNISLTSPATLNGYTPKNNKLFTYPYNALAITNNVGTQIEYHYEDFVNNSPNFYLTGTVTPSCSIMLWPSNYKKYDNAKAGYNWGMPIGKYPQGSWNSDQYTNWLTQNGVNILGHRIDAMTANAGAGAIQTIAGIATGNFLAGTEGIGNIFGAVQENYRHAMTPNVIGGQINSGDIGYAYHKMSPTYYKMSIKYEYAKIIDDYFSLYGYKVNSLKTPNIHKRSNWDYIKCIQVNLEGNIPEADLDTIRGLFNNGCTFWHTTTYFLDYSRTNSIL